MANRYYINTAEVRSTYFSDTDNWSLSSGGSGGASVPTIDDVAIFDSNSFPPGGQGGVDVDVAVTCKFSIQTSDVVFNINASGSISLQEAFSGLVTITVYGGLYTNNYNLTVDDTLVFLPDSIGDLGTSTITGKCFIYIDGSSVDVHAADIVIEGHIDYEYDYIYSNLSSSKTYNSLTINTNGEGCSISGSNSFGSLSILGDGQVCFNYYSSEETQTITEASGLILQGDTSGGLQLKNDTGGSSWWGIVMSDGVCSAENCTISNSQCTGGATFNASVSAGNIDGGENTGWNFDAVVATNTFELVFPALTGEAYISQSGFNITLPSLTAECFFGSTANMTLPMLQLESSILGSMQVVAELPVFTIATVINPHVNNYNIQLPVLSADASIRPFGIVVDGSLPSLSATSLFGSKVESTLPSLTGAGTIITGSTIDVDIDLPRLSAIVESQFKNKVDVNVRFPKLTCASTLFDIPVITIAGTLPALTGRVGILNERDLTGVCLNTEINAISLYTGWDINSMCEFNGEILCASEDGIFINSGDTDDGVDIDAYFTLFSSDLGINRVKRIRKIYVTGYLTGFLKVTSIFDTSEKTTYTVACPASLAETQVIIGTNYDEQGSLVGLKISNVDGSDFDIDTITVLLTVLSLHPKVYGQLIRGKFTLPSLTCAMEVA